MAHRLSRFRPIADAIARLFHPYAEVVLHDIIDDTIEYIANPFSGRATGDTSYMELDPKDPSLQKDVLGPYEKAGNNGQPIRSITAVLRSEDGDPMGILCINLNFSVLESALETLDKFVRSPDIEAIPEVLFRKDWRDLINLEIRSFLLETGKSLDSLDINGRISLLKRLEEKGLFYARKSVEQVAHTLKISRATVYKNLKEIRKDNVIIRFSRP
jgi:predicted transcriptional regulator YheO